MNVVVVVQKIKDPVNYSIEFLRALKSSLDIPITVTLISDHIIDFPDDIIVDLKLNYSNFEAFIPNTEEFINTQLNIQKQIAVSKKLGRRKSSEEIILEHMKFLSFYDYCLSKIKPDLVVVWNGITHSFQTSMVEVAQEKKIPIIFLERGLIPGTVFYDFEGVNFESSIGKNINWQQSDHLLNDPSIYDYVKDIINKTGGGLVELEVNKNINIPIDPYVFFPLQRDTDSNLLFNSPYIKNMFYILSILNQWKSTNLDLEFLVRSHPEDPEKHYTKLLDFDELIFQSDGDLLETIKRAHTVMTVNSTIGFTALILDKNIISLGNSVYSGKKLCIEPKSIDEIQELLVLRKDDNISDDRLALTNNRKDFINKIIANNHISFRYNALKNIQFKSLKNQIVEKLNVGS